MSQSRLTSGEANKHQTRKRENSQKPHTHENPDKTHQTKTRPRQQTKPKPRRRGSQKHQPGQRTTRQADKTNQSEGAGGRRQAGTSKQGRADAREGSRGRRERAVQAKVGAYSFSGVLRGVPQRGAHEQHPQHGGEGKAPHRAEAFVAMKRREDTSQSATTRHAKGMTTGPLQIQPDIRREGPAGLTGPESTRRQPRGEGRGEARKEQAQPQAPKPPEQTRKETATTPKPTNNSKKGGSPAAPRKKTTREARRQRPTTAGTSKAGKRRTAEMCGP